MQRNSTSVKSKNSGEKDKWERTEHVHHILERIGTRFYSTLHAYSKRLNRSDQEDHLLSSFFGNDSRSFVSFSKALKQRLSTKCLLDSHTSIAVRRERDSKLTGMSLSAMFQSLLNLVAMLNGRSRSSGSRDRWVISFLDCMTSSSSSFDNGGQEKGFDPFPHN